MSEIAWLVPRENAPHAYACWEEKDWDQCNYEFYDAAGQLRCCDLPRAHPLHKGESR